MENILRLSAIVLLLSIVLLFFMVSPHFCSALRPLSDLDLTDNSPSLNAQSNYNEENHLQPINEQQLDVLSPSLVAPEAQLKAQTNTARKEDQKNNGDGDLRALIHRAQPKIELQTLGAEKELFILENDQRDNRQDDDPQHEFKLVHQFSPFGLNELNPPG